MISLRDARLEEELQLGGLDPRAVKEVFGDLTAYLKQSIQTIAHEYWRYRDGDDQIAQQRVAAATDEAPVHDYYARTLHFLYIN